ncbi:MAG: tRNA (adenosine(37)-N6)-dimethylallyltransferase MiaA [Chitinophagaceae bacterium]
MGSAKNKTLVLIAGPTAVGKTAVAIELAKQYSTEIISADSRQCYKELKIGVARPSEIELAAIKHHFIATHSIHEEVTAAGFEQYALDKTNELFRDHDVVVMVGGTGLYIKAFCEGLDPIPAVAPATREKIIKNYKEKGIGWLQEELKQKDPEFFATGEIKNPQRMMRALEIVESSGCSILSFRKKEKLARDFNTTQIGLKLPKEQLHQHIHTRVDQMISAGLVDEVRSLIPYRQLNALKTVGYTELFDQLDGKYSLSKAVEQIKTNTRQYAKRQLTWFKRDETMKWYSPGDITGMKEFIRVNL